MSILTVGTNGQFTTIGAAVAAAQAGDTIEVAAGTYYNDHAVINAAVTIVGVGGMVDLIDTQPPPDEKGIFTVNADATIENISFSGAATDPGMGDNGAGIRYQAGNMTLINDVFHDNQDGVLGPPLVQGTGTIIVQGSTFYHNGIGDGQTHNMYIGNIATLEVSNSTFTNAVVGHELKSRAENNIIQNNTIFDGPTGTASYDIDLPDGGNDIVQGNTIEKGPDAQNSSIIHFGGEGIPYAGSSLDVTGNTIINDLGPQAWAVLNQTMIPVTVDNNTIENVPAAQIISGLGSESGNTDANGAPIPASSQTTIAPGTNTDDFSGDSLPHTVDVTQASWAVQGGGGLLTVKLDGAHIIAVGGAGGMSLTASPSSGGNTIYTLAGSTNKLTFNDANQEDTVNSAGTDTINFNTPGNKSVAISGMATVRSNGSDNSFTVNGGQALVAEGGGSDKFVISNNANVKIAGADAYLGFNELQSSTAIDVTQGSIEVAASVIGGSASGYVANGAMVITTSPGTIGASVSLGVGNVTVFSWGNDVIHTGAGTYTVQLHGAAQVYADNRAGTLNVFSQGDQGGTVYGGKSTSVNLYGDSPYAYVGGAYANTVNDFVSGVTIQGGSGRLTANVNAGRDVIQGGSGGMTLNDQGGGDTISTAVGATDRLNLAGSSTVTSAGNDVINVGDANCSIEASGTTTINGGAGASTFALDGKETLRLQSQATDTVTVSQGANATITSASVLTNITETGGVMRFVDTVAAGGAAHVNVNGGSAAVSALTGAVVAVTTQAGAAANVFLISGNIAVQSNGNDRISETGANATVVGGGGNMTFIGGSGTDVVYTGVGQDTITAGTGGLTVYDQSNAGTVFKIQGANTGGVVTINDFKVGIDKLVYVGFSQKSLVSSTLAGGALTLALSNHTDIVLPGVTHL